MSGVICLGAYLVVSNIYHNAVFAVLALVGGAIAPFAYVALMRSRRLRAFEKQFPEAIDLLGRAVRAGHSFTSGLEMIAGELAEPVATEFRTTFEEQNFGLPVRDALLNLTERVPLIDVQFFVTALLIQKETGGNLAEILDNLSHVVRERFRIYGEVRVKTAQGRLTAGILISVPPIMIMMMRVLNPSYIQVLFQDPIGPYILGGAAFLQVPGSHNDHDLGLFGIGPDAGDNPAGRSTVGLYHLAWEVPTLGELQDLADRLSRMGALVGASDHGTTKALYAKDPDGIEFEVSWLVPAELIDEETRKAAASIRPLDLAKEIARYGADTPGLRSVAYDETGSIRKIG